MASRISKIWKLSRPQTDLPATRWTCCKTILNSMIGRTRSLIRCRLHRIGRHGVASSWMRHWLWSGVIACAAAIADPPPPASTQGVPQSPPPRTHQSASDAPDDDFIEFLGTDDVGDAAWWEFLKKVPPRGGNPPAPSPQEAK